MKLQRLVPGLVLAAVVVGFGSMLSAAVKLPTVIGDSMVLQRDQPLPIWGWDEPGTEVTVSMGDVRASGRAGQDGKWLVQLPAVPAGGPYQMTVAGSDTVTLSDILVGEVWLCSGQSNMEWSVAASGNAEAEIAAADHPRIRHIKIARAPAETAQSDVPSSGWQVCSPQTAGQFTAVGYYFARHLQQQLDVPVGLIGSNWGGTRIEPWTPPEGFQQVPALKEIADNLENYPSKNDQGKLNHQSPLALYNGMIAPLVPYAIRGVLWYQGESNNGEGMLYYEKKKALIGGWRSLWQREDLPFYYVQLAPFRYGGDPTRLPGIWEAQLATLSVPYTGMAVTVDIGDVQDIHPRNKQDVGKRLALWALAKTYGQQDLVHSGPLYQGMKTEGDAIRLKFDHVADGLVSRDSQPLSHFTIAGADQEFVQAEARIDGPTVVVRSDQVDRPVAVRFAWHQEAEPNLANSAGLPASPFRTDGEQTQQQQQMVYELRTYTTVPGRLPALHDRFRQHTMGLFAKHGMKNVIYWIPVDKPDTLIYLLAHESQEAAEKSFAAFRQDPQWLKVREESEKDGPIVQKVESRFLKPTDYSPTDVLP